MGKLQTFIGKLRFDYGYGKLRVFLCVAIMLCLW
jgi:hypothetical protein